MRILLALLTVYVALSPAVLQAQTFSLGFQPVDAQYSPALDKIVMVSAAPNLLYICDPASNCDTIVTLPQQPLGVLVSTDGMYAAVLESGQINYVSLASATLTGAPGSTFPSSGNYWASPDGNWIYTSSATVLHASDMSYAGSLSGLSGVQSLAASASTIAAIPSASTGSDTEVRLYESTYLNQTGRFVLPDGGHGKWVFLNTAVTNPGVTQIYVIAQVGSSYALDTMDLADPVACISGFASSTGVTVASSGALENASITSNTDCAFQATSNVGWIQLVSGAYGSGDTTLTYVVRPNTSSQSRAGTITLNSGASLSVFQQGSSGPLPGLINLSVNPVATDYSKALDELVYVSAAPNELHVYDPNSQSDTFVPLALAPTSVSVDPTGLFAAVGHDGWISYVNLQSKTVQQPFPVPAHVNSLALTGNGNVYFYPNPAIGEMFTLNINNRTVTLSLDAGGGQIPRFDSTANALYVSGGELSMWDLSQAPPIFGGTTFSTCGNLWLSEDGSRIYTACSAAMYNASDLSDLSSEISSIGTVQWAADSKQNNSLAVIPLYPPRTNGSLIDSYLQMYSTADLSFTNESTLPPFQVSGTNYVGHGKYVFWNKSESSVIVVEQADSTAPLISDYGVYVTPCSYSASASSLTISGAGSTGNLTIASGSGCAWSAQSQAPWIQIVNGSGIGNGTFAFNAGLNSGPGTRMGTISVAGQTITISQPAYVPACSYSVSTASIAIQGTGTAGNTSVTVTAGNGCSWSAQSQAPWIQIVNGSGIGNGTFAFNASLNSGPGIRTGTISVAGQTITISQPATAVAQISTLTVAFSNQPTGILSSTWQTVAFTNASSVTVSFTGVGISGSAASDFLMEGNTCAGALPGGASCAVTIAFQPMVAGSRIAYLTFSDNAYAASQTVALTGTGTQYLPTGGGSVGPIPHTGDFDGDGKADLVIWRPSEGNWYILPSSGNPKPFLARQWGLAGDVPLTADFNGDKRSDFVVWRPSDGTWYVLFSSQPSSWPPSIVQQWGLLGDIPVSGDFNGDGKADFAVWRPSNGTWYVLFSNQASSWPPSMVQQWGFPGDIPVPGDYDGDGKTDFAVWRPSNVTWYIIPSSNPAHPIIQQWGFSTDIPVAADFDGDGKTDMAVWRPSEANWYIIPSGNPTHPIVQQWGLPGDLPQIGDFSGQHKASFAIWRPSNTSWFVLNQKDVAQYPAPSLFAQWGVPDDIPM